MNEPSLFIAGKWLVGKGSLMTSLDPSTGHIVWQSHGANSAQVEEAVVAARQAFLPWSRLSYEQREAYIREFRHLLEKHNEVIAEYIGLETGKPLWESQTEVNAMISKVDISIEAHHQRAGTRRTESGGVSTVLRHRPHGVLAVFGPYNFPGHLPNGHIIPALLAGNTVVFKPSEQTPMVAEQIVDLWHQAELPDGVINLVQGDAHVGDTLASHPQIDGLLFTGSAATGTQIHKLFAGHPGKILALEMGGNNPLIFDRVQDLDAAAHTTLISAYLSAGQRCTCARRLLVPAGADGDRFIETLVEAIGKIRVGRFDQDPPPFMGPVISEQAADHLLAVQNRLRVLGATPLVMMEKLQPGTGLLSPGLMDVSAVEDLPDEEHFGPLLCLIRYRDFDEALEVANRTEYGLSAGLLSDNEERYQQFLQEIRAGIVNRNRPLTGASSALPFGGIGASGNLRPSAFYAADYCAYPVASLEADSVSLPEQPTPGLDPS